jgi:hypothetical protein
MGRSFKQRKIKKIRRVKIKGSKPDTGAAVKDKKTMHTWEYFLLGAALILAIVFIIFAARTGSVVPDSESTPTAVATTAPA